jgi:hypothetical protein
MVGRNFWAVQQGGEWTVYEEGLPDATTRHGDRDSAWAAANERAASCHGEAFLKDGSGDILDRKWHGSLLRDIKPV